MIAMKLRYLLPALLLGALPLATSHAQIGISINIAPPVLPVVVQPPCPVANYLWTPGYWAYADTGYYWVDGLWVAPPRVGFLWTPGYWGCNNGIYAFNAGYWGSTIGFYGGVNYGFGYGGYGYYGGRWDGGNFRYNTAVTRVNTTIIRNTYIDKTVINKAGGATSSRASFNGPGGVNARPDARQLAAARGTRLPATSRQVALRNAARKAPGARSTARQSPAARDARTANASRNQRPVARTSQLANDRQARTSRTRVNNAPRREPARQAAAQTRFHGRNAGGGRRPNAATRPQPVKRAPQKAVAHERKRNEH